MTKRTKEIGIRKVVGASGKNLFLVLTKEFNKWILVANIIAWPVAYYVMDLWLKNFAYKIELSWWTFVIAGFLGFFVALVVIGFSGHKNRDEKSY